MWYISAMVKNWGLPNDGSGDALEVNVALLYCGTVCVGGTPPRVCSRDPSLPALSGAIRSDPHSRKAVRGVAAQVFHSELRFPCATRLIDLRCIHAVPITASVAAPQVQRGGGGPDSRLPEHHRRRHVHARQHRGGGPAAYPVAAAAHAGDCHVHRYYEMQLRCNV